VVNVPEEPFLALRTRNIFPGAFEDEFSQLLEIFIGRGEIGVVLLYWLHQI